MPLSERLRLLRLTAADRELREIGKAADALGVSRQSLSRYEEGRRPIPLKVLHQAAEIFGVDIATMVESADARVKIVRHKRDTRDIEAHMRRLSEQSSPTAASSTHTPRTFNTEAERISYALGVLDMAGTSNRLVIETSNEVSRAISAASAALLAPITGPAPVAPGPTDAQLLAKHDSAQTAPATGAGKVATKKRPATARRSG